MSSSPRDGGPAAVPKYQRIAAALRQELQGAAHGPGGRLPSERALAARYRVNRQTVRAALQQLRDDGLIVTERRGTRSAAPAPAPTPASAPAPPPAAQAASGAAASCAPPGAVLVQSWLARVTVPPSLAALLGVRGGERTLVHHRRERGPAGQTLQHAVTYVCPRALAEEPGLAGYRRTAAVRDEDPGPLDRWLDRAAREGRVAETITMTLSHRQASAAAAGGLSVRRTLHDDAGRLLAVTDLSFPTWDRLTFHRDRAVSGFQVS
ncbi:GntR family transcriptional regulator [Streptomyces globosus]|uniref:GntR family transcriptional regulator n=1 Tax=Streptomyces globosus TaxID=68209 RepID=UPI003642F52B